MDVANPIVHIKLNLVMPYEDFMIRFDLCCLYCVNKISILDNADLQCFDPIVHFNYALLSIPETSDNIFGPKTKILRNIG